MYRISKWLCLSFVHDAVSMPKSFVCLKKLFLYVFFTINMLKCDGCCALDHL